MESNPLLARRSKAKRIGAASVALVLGALAVVYAGTGGFRVTLASLADEHPEPPPADGPPKTYPFNAAPKNAQKLLETRIQDITKKAAKKDGCTMTMGFSRSDLRAAGAAGKDGGPEGKSVTVEDKFAGGSLVKPLTAASIMRLQQDGKLSIDDPMLPYVDEYIAFISNSTEWPYTWKSLVELFGEDKRERLESMTIKKLLAMEAPFADIDTSALQNELWNMKNPGYKGPFELINLPIVKDNFPWLGWTDGWGFYSTTTYMMLGFILAGDQHVTPEDLDQGIFLSDQVKKLLSFGDGQPVKDFSPVHPIDVVGKKRRDWWPKAGPMVGWAGSNILASGQGYADMFLEIYDGSVTTSAAEMATVVTFDAGGAYGLGTEIEPEHFGEAAEFPCGYGEVYGHGGGTYGSSGIGVYSPRLQASIGLANTDACGDGRKELCLAYAAAIKEIDGHEFDCNHPKEEPKGGCDKPKTQKQKKKKSDGASVPSALGAAAAAAALAFALLG